MGGKTAVLKGKKTGKTDSNKNLQIETIKASRHEQETIVYQNMMNQKALLIAKRIYGTAKSLLQSGWVKPCKEKKWMNPFFMLRCFDCHNLLPKLYNNKVNYW